jgi:hypothetical protein
MLNRSTGDLGDAEYFLRNSDFYTEAIGEPPYWDNGLALVLSR